MKKYLLCLFCIGLLCSRCKKESQSHTDPLIGKWQFYLDAITYTGTDACQYKSKPSDVYLEPSPYTACKRDNVWAFSPNNLTISSGAVKCIPNEPDQLVQAFQKTDSSLTINGRTYRIVMLSRDTLIIDDCVQMNNNVPGLPPVGPYFVRLATKFFRLR